MLTVNPMWMKPLSQFYCNIKKIEQIFWQLDNKRKSWNLMNNIYCHNSLKITRNIQITKISYGTTVGKAGSTNNLIDMLAKYT